ncbi:hypothetical protein [Nocardiopsis potens]|uniref:hypothetical protein n=1 Tax=Nocardiopsis potens TaxID=1246458 RepID=UPI00034A4E74|nr:hypothetical protein [Nocardiopsis potens]
MTTTGTDCTADRTALPGAEGGPPHRIVLDLDPMTRAELERAAGGRSIEAYLYLLAGRCARWTEMRDWLAHLEACYGPIPAEALERLHRKMLGLRPVRGAGSALGVAFTDEELAALKEAADGRALAPFVRETVLDRLTAAAEDTADPGPGGG